ncbi:hypothetical protein TNCV_852951 [Trichonephila clavipes]|nr:hypothetical protein TNCV_852951 [Trichonephila clavipes]
MEDDSHIVTLEWLAAGCLELATSEFNVHALDDWGEKGSYSGQSIRTFIPVLRCLQLEEEDFAARYISMMTLDVTGKWNAKRSSIPYRDF